MHATKTAILDEYLDLDLHQLELTLANLQRTSKKDSSSKAKVAALHQAIRKRQRKIKAKAIEFEQTNDHHLLVFDSTDGFSKIAGNSVLFYAFTIADRLHRRYNIKTDTDSYSCSPEGIISIRKLTQLEELLTSINIYPDPAQTTSELHFYKLTKAYKESQIATLRDQLSQDIERITKIINPYSPIPELYTLILEVHRLIYFGCARVSDQLFRHTLADRIILTSDSLIACYLDFANPAPKAKPQLNTTFSQNYIIRPTKVENLIVIVQNARKLRSDFACLDNLQLIHRRELRTILEKLVEIERMAEREYFKYLRRQEIYAKKSSARATNTPDTNSPA